MQLPGHCSPSRAKASIKQGLVVLAHTFNPSTQETEASWIYTVSSRTARATQRNPCLGNGENKKPSQHNNNIKNKKQKNYVSTGKHKFTQVYLSLWFVLCFPCSIFSILFVYF